MIMIMITHPWMAGRLLDDWLDHRVERLDLNSVDEARIQETKGYA